MRKILIGLLLAAVFGVACHHRSRTPSPGIVTPKDTSQVHFFFPVTDFIRGELRIVDSIPVTPLMITVKGDKRDSSWISKSTLNTMAAAFLTPVIDSQRMQAFFSVSSFLDQTIHAVTLTYDPKVNLPDSLTLNHWDVYIDPDHNTVQRVYMVKESEVQGATVTTQLTWETGKSFRIRTITEEQKTGPEVKEEIVKWNFDE